MKPAKGHDLSWMMRSIIWIVYVSSQMEVCAAAGSSGRVRRQIPTPSKSTVVTVTSTVIASSSIDVVTSTSIDVVTSTSVPANFQLPTAFDSTLGVNFYSTACPSFFATFLALPRFTACAPFSLVRLF
jgi:hypothetical protein